MLFSDGIVGGARLVWDNLSGSTKAEQLAGGIAFRLFPSVLVAGFQHLGVASRDFLVRLAQKREVLGVFRQFLRQAVVVVLSNRHQFSQPFHATEMIAVPMGNDEVI